MLETLTRSLFRPAASISDDFDFLMGIWRCRHRYRVRRLGGCNDWIEFDGTCAARKILGQWAVGTQLRQPRGDGGRDLMARHVDRAPCAQAITDLIDRPASSRPSVHARYSEATRRWMGRS